MKEKKPTEKELKSKTLSNLSAQKAAALARNDSKTAALVQRIIDLLTKK